MSLVQLNCPLCSGAFQVDDSLSGHDVNCPNCQGVVTIPPLDSMGPPPTSEPWQLGCPVCAGIFQVTPDMAGMLLACPHCNGEVAIPAGFETPAPPEETPLSEFFPAGFGRKERPAPRGRGPAAAFDAAQLFPPAFEQGESQLPAPPLPESLPPESSPILPEKSSAPSTKARSQRGESETPPIIARRPGPNVDDLLPPGAGGIDSLLPPEVVSSPPIDNLLPPGASSGPAVDSFLPPAASLPPAAAPPEVADQFLPPGSTLPSPPEPAIEAPIGVEEPPITPGAARSGDGRKRRREGDLKRLPSDKKASRRRFRHLVVGAFCLLVLIATLYALVYTRG